MNDMLLEIRNNWGYCKYSQLWTWFIHLNLTILNLNNRRSSITKTHLFPYFEKQKKIHSLTYRSKVPVGLQHNIFVEIHLGRIQQIPFFFSEVHMHIIISHCILKYPRNMCNTKHDTNITTYYLTQKLYSNHHVFLERNWIIMFTSVAVEPFA